MKRCLLFILFATITTITHAQLEEDFDPEPTGWILSQGAKITGKNGNNVIETPGVGGNNPAYIGTPAVNKTSNTVKVCFSVWAYGTNGDGPLPFPCNTYADILFVKSTVNSSKDAENQANIYATQSNYLLPTNGGVTCFQFTFPDAVTASSFKVFISFKADCNQGGVNYVIDNISISGIALICGGTNCAPVALNDIFNRGNGTETSFSGALFGANLNPGYPTGYTVDAGGTDNDQNDGYSHLQWIGLTQPANGSVVVNSDGTFTVTRNSTTVTQLTFTYRLSDDGADNDFALTTDNMTDDATVTINWPPAASLPVSFTSFTGSRNGQNVTLQWTTSMESNNTGFEIQRSTGNGAYEKVGFVATKAANGYSNLPLTYLFTEANTAKANTWYRVVQIDKDGTRKMTPLRGVRGMEELVKLTVYPNPGTATNMNVLFGSSALRDIKIIDLNGKVMKQWNSYHDDNMSITGLHTGIYMLIVTDKSSNERLTQKIMIK